MNQKRTSLFLNASWQNYDRGRYDSVYYLIQYWSYIQCMCNEWCECFGKSVVDVRYCTFNMCVKHLSDCWKLDCCEHCLGSYSLCSHNLSSLARFEHVTCEHVTAGQFVHWWKFSVLNTTAMQISSNVFYLCTNLYT